MRDYNVKALLEGIKPEKERLIEAEQLLNNDKIESNIPGPPPPVKVMKKESSKKRIWKTVWWLTAAIAGLIGVLAAIFALLDSASFKEFIKKLLG
ncbi:MAG: hypothetical protein JSV88_15720 [Candidatus Aminicenantes bacterium]|nr:MAG: hypothetical protein JSV88_15720 [Candidatus Aminicenantes bacterium]